MPYALPLAADPELLIPAILVLLFLIAASYVLNPLLVRLGLQIPILGSSLVNAATTIVNNVVSDLDQVALGLVSAVVSLLLTPVFWLYNWLVNLERLVELLGDSLVNLGRVTVPQLLASGLTEVAAYAQSLVRSLEGQVAAVGAMAQAGLAELRGEVTSDVSQVAAYASGLAAGVLARAGQEIGAAEARLEGEVHAAEAEVDASILTVVHGLEGEIHAAEATLEAALAGDVRGLGQAIDGARAEANAGLAALDGVLSQAIEGRAAAAAAATAAVAATLSAWLEQCGDPLCSDLQGFGKGLSLLEGALGWGALIALIAEAAKDPEGAAKANLQAFGPPLTAAADAARAVFGV